MSHSDGSELPITNPSTSEIIARVAPAQDHEIQAAVDNARHAQVAWAKESVTERRKWILKWRLAILDQGDRLATTVASENGKPLHEAWLHEIAPLCDAMAWLCEAAPRILDESEPSLRWLKHQHSQIWRKPRGVCAVIAPYNFPLFIPFADAAAALMAGCSVIIKPSERTPLVAQAVVELAREAGLPHSLLQVLAGGPNVARQLLATAVDEVVFTGSTEHGREVAIQCARGLIPCTLELGGGATAMVFDDANLEQAASAITFGSLANSGQSCIAIERVFARAAICGKLVDAIADCVRALRQGDPQRREVDLGAMTSGPQLTKVDGQVQAALSQGARLICGGKRATSAGNFYEPTVLTDCRQGMEIVTGETFGPVIPIVPIDGTVSLVEMANRSSSSLAAYVFGRDTEYLCGVARDINANQVLINDVLWSYISPELPFGGHGSNGWGVVHGPEGLLAHTYAAHIGRARMRLPASLGFGFPYAKTPRAVLKHALRLFTR